MLTAIQWLYLLACLLCAIAGGYLPLSKPEYSRESEGFPKGEAFASGVFLALSLTMLLPSAFLAVRKALPDIDYPVASVIAIVAFLILLALEHLAGHLVADSLPAEEETRIPSTIPLILTAMIAFPSFFLGAALGVSEPVAAALIFVAIVLHKSTAGFALAVAMTRSNLSRPQTLILYSCFAVSTPLGILFGGSVREYMSGSLLLLKAIVLALGAGTFLYMGTLHDMKRASLIHHCCKLSCFLTMLAGLGITALVRWIVGEAHQF